MDKRDGQWRRSTSPRTSCSAHGAMPILLPVQRCIMRAELWALLHALILSESGATFITDCATVLQHLERGPMWCSAGRRPQADVWRRIWERFRDIGEEAHTDSVTKCKTHLSMSEQAKLDDAGRVTAAGNEWADELAKEGARDDSFQSFLSDTSMKLSKKTEPSSTTLGTSSSERNEESDGQMSSHHLRSGTRRTSDGNARRRSWRAFTR